MVVEARMQPIGSARMAARCLVCVMRRVGKDACVVVMKNAIGVLSKSLCRYIDAKSVLIFTTPVYRSSLST